MSKNKILDNYQFKDEVTEFDSITFQNTNFSNRNLCSFEFIDCTFISCDFSMARIENVVFTRVKFVQSKTLGLDFSVCSKFAFSLEFDNCILNYCHFHKNNLKKTSFKKCMIKEAGFFELDLTSASFDDCDLTDTVFEKCDLSNCDFRTADNYNIVPEQNSIKKAKFSYPGVLGLLSHYNIILED